VLAPTETDDFLVPCAPIDETNADTMTANSEHF